MQIRPHFDYSSVLLINISKKQKALLERQLNESISFVYSINHRTGTSLYRKKLTWLSLVYRRQYLLAVTSYQIIIFKRPLYLYKLLNPYFHIPSQLSAIRTRSKPTFNIPLPKNRHIPESIKRTLNNFKRLIRNFQPELSNTSQLFLTLFCLPLIFLSSFS